MTIGPALCFDGQDRLRRQALARSLLLYKVARRLLQIHCMTYRGGTTISLGIHAKLTGQMKMSVIERSRRRADVIDEMNTNFSRGRRSCQDLKGKSHGEVQLHALRHLPDRPSSSLQTIRADAGMSLLLM